MMGITHLTGMRGFFNDFNGRRKIFIRESVFISDEDSHMRGFQVENQLFNQLPAEKFILEAPIIKSLQ
jgi:hypothetical protein